MQFCLTPSRAPVEPAVPSSHALEDEIAALHKQIEDLESDLARSERLATLGAMSGAIAHEFNNLLTPLLNYAAMALAHPEDERLTRKALEKTIQSAERASQVADALLGSLQEQSASPDGCHLREAVENALTGLVRPPVADGIEVLIDISHDLRVAISPTDLNQVLLNLILNACEAMRPGPGTLAITAACLPALRLDQGHLNNANISRTNVAGKIVLRIVDTGPGMTADLVERVFDPLVTTKQREPGARKQGGGSGLGLTVCKRLIQRAGGTITLRSEPGIGTSFSIHLPSCIAKENEQSATVIAA